MRVTLAGLGLTTTVRVVNRVHGSTTNGRADAAPTLGTGLAQLFQAVLVVADFADGGAALDRNLAHFTRAQAQGGVDAFTSHQLHGRTSGTSDLSALPGFSSMQWMVVPTGMLRSGRVLPALIGASEPAIT